MLDPSGNDDEMETKVVSILGDTDSEVIFVFSFMTLS